jgi:putative transposase
MIAFIDEPRAVDGVEPICRVLPIAPSPDHAHAARRADPSKRPARSRSDAALAVEIRRVYEATFCVYGAQTVCGNSAGRGSRWPAARWRG